jgi:hypothetical protein
MSAHCIDGYVIVSADGMLADANRKMPDTLKFEGDQRFFNAALDRADLIVHGRHSHEGQPYSPKRKRIVVTSATPSLSPDPSNPNAPASVPARSRSSADQWCSRCFSTATTRSGCRWPRTSACPAAIPVFPECQNAHRRKFWPRTG